MDIFLAPELPIIYSFGTLFVITVAWNACGLFQNNTYFAWGAPVTLLGGTITDTSSFYLILLCFFFHQLGAAWVRQSLLPFVILTVQNPQVPRTDVGNRRVLIILICYTIIFVVDIVLVIHACLAQVSFAAAFMLASIVVGVTINAVHLYQKPLGSESSPIVGWYPSA